NRRYSASLPAPLQPLPRGKSFERRHSPYGLCWYPLVEPAVMRLIISGLVHPPSASPEEPHADIGGVQVDKTQVVPEHVCMDGQSAFVRHCTQLVPLRQCGVPPLHVAHVGPQCTSSLHGWHCIRLHHLPAGQSPFALHWTHAPFTQPAWQGVFDGI